MQKNMLAKISLGVGTGIYFLTPWLMLGLWLVAVPFFILASANYTDTSVLFLFVLFLFSLICLLALLLHLVLMPVYMSLLLRSTQASMLMRTLLGIGLLFLPCIAAPIFYLTYIVPAHPPAWALEPKAAPESSKPEIQMAAPAETSAAAEAEVQL